MRYCWLRQWTEYHTKTSDTKKCTFTHFIYTVNTCGSHICNIVSTHYQGRHQTQGRNAGTLQSKPGILLVPGLVFALVVGLPNLKWFSQIWTNRGLVKHRSRGTADKTVHYWRSVDRPRYGCVRMLRLGLDSQLKHFKVMLFDAWHDEQRQGKL